MEACNIRTGIEDEILFILNPVAGSGRSGKMFDEAEALLKQAGVNYSVIKTEHPGHATEIAQKAVGEGSKFIVAVGGDGTVGEVAPVLLGKDELTFGVLPFGTGNDFAKSLNIPSNAEKAVEILLSNNVKKVDMGFAAELHGEKRQKFFVNVAGQGFDVSVLENTAKHAKKAKGMIPYLIGVAEALIHKTKLRVRIKCRELEKELDMLICIVGNGKCFGGGMLGTPLAEVDDGKFDICLVKDVSTLTFLRLLPAFIKGKHIKSKVVNYFRTSEIIIDSDENYLIETDGEIILRTPVLYKILPGVLRVIKA